MGWIKPRRPKDTTPQYYDLWAKEDPNAILGRHKMHIPAPKMRLPGHEESYNPPPEYLLTEEEVFFIACLFYIQTFLHGHKLHHSEVYGICL